MDHKYIGKVKCIREDSLAETKVGEIYNLYESYGLCNRYIICERYPNGRYLYEDLSDDNIDPKYELITIGESYEEIVKQKDKSKATDLVYENPIINKGLRYNSNKLRWRNFPMFLMEPLIEVAQYGESKYDTFNFLKGQTILDLLDSLKRHLTLFENPYEPDEDKESQINHLAHVAWNALVAVHMMKTRPDMDDRFKVSEEDIKAYAEKIQKRGR